MYSAQTNQVPDQQNSETNSSKYLSLQGEHSEQVRQRQRISLLANSALTLRQKKQAEKIQHATQNVIQKKPSYRQIDYQWNSGDPGTCFSYRKNTNNFSEVANFGCKSGSSIVHPGSNAGNHSEESILQAETGVSRESGEHYKSYANKILAQKKGQISLNLYSELQPCNNEFLKPHSCRELLDLVLKDGSMVTFSFYSRDAKKQGLANAQQQ